MNDQVALAKYEFKKLLEKLRQVRGRATELISLYVPPTRQISDVVSYLRNEYAQSSNIKSRTTRKNVMWAIDSLLGKLKVYKQPPPNGVVFFIGTKSVSSDQTEPISYVIEPPEPINTYMYRCDSSFYLGPLEEQLAEKDTYGLIVIDRSEATVGILKGKRVNIIKNIQSLVPSKHSRGGQSARRFERLIEIAAHEFYVKVAGLSNEAFINEKDMKGILVGGPGATKEYFINEGYLHHDLQKKVVPTLFDTGYTDEYGLRELVEKASETLKDLDLMKEKKIVQKLMEEIKRVDGGLAVYGESEVRAALKQGAVDTVLLSEALRKYRLKLKCSKCDYTKEETIKDTEQVSSMKCLKCQSNLEFVDKKDIVDELYKLADQTNTKVVLISNASPEGEMLLKAFGGIAALLRYKAAK